MTCFLHGSTARDFLGNNISDQELRQLELGADFHDLEVIVERLGNRRFMNWVATYVDGEGYDLGLVSQLRRAAKAK